MSDGSRSPLSRSQWGLLLTLAAVQFTHILDFVIIMPLGERLMKDLGLSPVQFGWVVSSYGLAAFFSSLLASGVIDRFDRKRALLTLYAGFAGSTLLCGLSPLAESLPVSSYTWLLMTRALAGAFGGLASAGIMAILGDVFPPAQRGRAAAAVMSAFAVASIAGLPIGLTLANRFGWGTPFLALAGVSVGVWVAAALLLPKLTGHLTAVRPSARSQFAAVAREPNHWRAFAWTFCLVMGTFTVVPFLGPFFTLNGGRTDADLPIIYSVAGVFTLVSMNLIGGVADRVGKRRTFRVMAVASLLTVLLTTNLPAVSLATAALVAALFMVTASGRMVPAQALMIGAAAPRLRGAFMSLNAATQHLATGVAPLISGAILSRSADGRHLDGFPAVGLVAAGFAVASLLLSEFVRQAPVEAAAPPPVVPVEVAEAVVAA